jgi:uncharacterized membrane protein YjjP (DUF1212 family)
VTGAIAFAAGGIAAAVTAGPAILADAHFPERPPLLALSMTAFGVLGAVISLLAHRHWKPVAIGLIASSLLVAAVFGADDVREPKMIVLIVGFALGNAAAGAVGALLGARWRHGVS